METTVIRNWLEKEPDEAPGKQLGAVLLGQRGVSVTLPKKLARWMRCGSALSRWPPDLVCQILDKGNEPLQLARIVSAYRMLKSSAVALAALEYSLCAAQGEIGSWLKTLCRLLDVFNKTCQEPGRRWDRLWCLVNQAFQLAPSEEADKPYQQITRNQLAYLWMNLFHEALSKLLCEMCDAQGLPGALLPSMNWPSYSGLIGGLEDAWRYYQGYDLPETLTKDLEEIETLGCTEMAELQKRVLDALVRAKRRLSRPSMDWEMTVVGLSGRVAAFGNSSQMVTHLASWLDQCHEKCAPGQDGDGALKLAVGALETSVAFLGWVEPKVVRVAEVLNIYGADLLYPAVLPAFKSSLQQR